jgi:tetratricopeptide (TPR) repeat protein
MHWRYNERMFNRIIFCLNYFFVVRIVPIFSSMKFFRSGRWVIVLSAFSCLFSFSQKINLDSLRQELKKPLNDTSRLNILIELGAEERDTLVIEQYLAETKILAEKFSLHKEESLKLKGEKGIACYHENLAGLLILKAKIPEAIKSYLTAIELFENINGNEEVIRSLISLGLLYNRQGNIPRALECLDKGLKLARKTADKKAQGEFLNSLGIIYQTQGDPHKALESYTQSLRLREELGFRQGIANSLHNLAAVYLALGDEEKSLDYNFRSLKMKQEIGFKRGEANSLNNIGGIYENRGELLKAMDFYGRALVIWRKLNDQQGISNIMNSIGTNYFRQKKYSEARRWLDSALLIGKKLGYPKLIINAERVLAKTDSATGNYLGAYEHYKQFVSFRDSLVNTENKNASIKSQLTFEYEKKEAVMQEQQEKERAVAKEQSRVQKIIIWSVTGGLLLLLISVVLIYRSLLQNKKAHKIISSQKKEVELQKFIVEEKQKEILDSIYYAKRIQTVLFASEKYIERELRRLSRRKSPAE